MWLEPISWDIGAAAVRCCTVESRNLILEVPCDIALPRDQWDVMDEIQRILQALESCRRRSANSGNTDQYQIPARPVRCCGQCDLIANVGLVQVCAFANATCGSFVAITQTGYLQLSIQNTGYIASGYTVEVG